ncbi:hypothetical protein ACFPYI_15730 [Halomarina salina]|uniref:CARDB domain-containing protein n=1 Tax=Halomarina salina TaxID=1872699 RepID=A0ABD5RQ52_9EURY|nr:hypothetical protein [Halomarina salina]
MSNASEDEGQLPPLLDVRDALDDIEREADADVSDDVDAIRADLDRLAEHDEASDSVVSDVEDDVLALRERLSGDADMYAEAVENRIRQYRTSRQSASDTVDIADPRLARNGTAVDLERQRGETVDVEGVLVNQGESRAATVLTAFHDDDGTVSRTVESRAYDLDAGEKRDVSLTVFVPDDAAYYAVSAVDADDPRTVAGDEPEPDTLERDRREAAATDDDRGRGRNEDGDRSTRENAGGS